MKKLNLVPNLNYTQSYGTAGMSQNQAIGAYFTLPMRFEKASYCVPRCRPRKQKLQSPDWTHSSNMCSPPPSCPSEEDVPLLDPAAIIILPGSQVIIDSQISYKLPEKLFLELYSPGFLSCREPWLCPGILD
ncbi:hypothetical protein DSO57_1022024 [Entomophthora muscae]|uniref:Uncharacterized protein n=1 Tax=Entomophthora muscae TaxID=34485 RepID=A0ACC2UCW4_9FUNG|nr:hypothetical protein DSO57_1022024 [Entomophthora muscae]